MYATCKRVCAIAVILGAWVGGSVLAVEFGGHSSPFAFVSLGDLPMSEPVPLSGSLQQDATRPRAREAGIVIGVFEPGKHNAITDVSGVTVGHATLNEGQSQCTGVTAILPHDDNIFQHKVPAAIAVGNGFGKLVGVTQVRELGLIETPILLTNTVSTFAVADALVAYTLNLPDNEDVQSVNPIVGECNDGFLNDIRAMSVGRNHVLAAIKAARDGQVAEGCVGAGTGTRCMGFKGGIGTASRLLPEHMGGYTIGILIQTNFGGILNVGGAPVGEELGVRSFRHREQIAASSQRASDNAGEDVQAFPDEDDQEHGSCMIVVATDAPLNSRQLERLARRALLGLAAVGSPMTHGSGDYAIAFSTAEELRVPYVRRKNTQAGDVVRDDRLSPLFQAAKEAAEEAVLNSLFRAETTTGRGGRVSKAMPLDRVLEICRRHGVLKASDDGKQ
ncbi:MAG: P1 family peptidase [Pirellulales bacterium]|nr:P1 family peptidase [Pirellulales bacterium]